MKKKENRKQDKSTLNPFSVQCARNLETDKTVYKVGRAKPQGIPDHQPIRNPPPNAYKDDTREDIMSPPRIPPRQPTRFKAKATKNACGVLRNEMAAIIVVTTVTAKKDMQFQKNSASNISLKLSNGGVNNKRLCVLFM